MHRQAAVAGVFYPADAGSVRDFIKTNLSDVMPEEASAVLVPHAGYVYSGATCVRTLSRVKIPDTVILAGPNHTGAGPDISVYPAGSWETPLGAAWVDEELTAKICEHELFTPDTKAHMSEHSLEVIVPVLQYLNPDVQFVFITAKYIALADLKNAAEHISSVTDALFVISSDFNHFEDVQTTEKKDKAAIDKLLAMDTDGLYKVIPEMRISMCGIVPACMGLEYSINKGAVKPVFVEHTHSGAVNSDNERVVGYAGLYYKKEDL